MAILKCQPIRCVWNYETEQWYYSVVDIIGILTECSNPRRHWSDLKRGLLNPQKQSRGELYDKIVQFKLVSKDDKKRPTDTLPAEALSGLLDLIPRVEVPKFRQWVGAKRYAAKDKTLHRQYWKEVL